MLGFCVYQPLVSLSVLDIYQRFNVLSYLGIKLGRLMRDRQTKFETWSEFKAWIDKQAELENHLAGNVQIVKAMEMYRLVAMSGRINNEYRKIQPEKDPKYSSFIYRF